MVSTVREACRELTVSMLDTVEQVLALAENELLEHSDHVCAQDKDVWALITNDIDHEKIHVGQVLEGRYESRKTADRLARVLGEWLEERARLVAALVGMTDGEFGSETAPGQWTYERVVRHVIAVERDSLRSMLEHASAKTANG